MAIGCAPSLKVVDEAAMKRVPPADAAKVADKEGKQAAEARAQQPRADEELAAARKALDAEAAERAAAEETTRKARAALAEAKKAGDQRAVDQAQLDVVIAEEGERLQAAKRAWLVAQVAWRERMREAAEARGRAMDASVELARAELAAKAAPVDEPYDLAPFRGQHGRLHEAWSEARNRVALAHAELDKRAGELAAAKQKYATARKVVLPPPLVATDEKPGAAPAK